MESKSLQLYHAFDVRVQHGYCIIYIYVCRVAFVDVNVLPYSVKCKLYLYMLCPGRNFYTACYTCVTFM